MFKCTSCGALLEDYQTRGHVCKMEVDNRDVWAMKLELTFPVLPDDLKKELQDDSEADFARRAFERVRPALNKLLEEGVFKHYHIMERPRKVID